MALRRRAELRADNLRSDMDYVTGFCVGGFGESSVSNRLRHFR